MKNQKIIVAHPGQQHSYRVAAALNQSGILYKYITTIYDKKDSRLMGFVKAVIGTQDRSRAKSRHISSVDDAQVVQFCALSGMLLLLILRLDHTKSRAFYNRFNQMVSARFGKKVARFAIKHHVDAVICYDTNAMECFRILKKKAPYIKRILDNAAPNRYGLYQSYQKLNQQYGMIDQQPDAFKDYLKVREKAEYYRQEALMADAHIVASTFSLKMLRQIGITDQMIKVIPYGFNKQASNVCEAKKEADCIRFLFVGEMSAQKGLFNYLEMAKKYKGLAEFHAVGGGIGNLPAAYRASIQQNLVYHGYLLQRDLYALYSQMDLLVFPSLGDGFGFVVLEALSHGLPVICSRNSIGEDIIEDYQNGFLFDAGNSSQLNEIINWTIHNKKRIATMRNDAMLSVEQYSWDRYSEKLNDWICEVIGN